MLAGTVLFHYGRADLEDLPPQLRAMVAALLLRGARLVVMGERGAGTATQHDLDRCAEAVYRHLGMPDEAFARGAQGLVSAIDFEIDRCLLEFFSGPNLPLILLVERLAPDLAPGSRAQIAGVLEELIRDVAEQFGTARLVNAPA